MRLVRRPSQDEPQRVDELEALLAAARAAVEHPEPGQALETILDAAIRLVGGDEGSVQLLDRATRTLSVMACRGLGPAARRQVVALGQGISGTVAVTGQALLLPSAVDVDRFVGYVPKDRPIYGALCVPLRTREEIIGVLSVNRTTSGPPFSDRDLRLVTLFAETAAHTIVNSQLLAESRRHAVELELLRGATLRLGTTLEVDQVAEITLSEALSIAGSDAGFICVIGPEGHDLELARFSGLPGDALHHVLANPAFRRATATAEMRVVTDLISDTVFEPLAAALSGRSLAVVPLLAAESRPSAVLGVAVPNGVPAELRRLLWTYASQAALAIANALLHRRVASREEKLDTMVSAIDLPIILLDEARCFRSINRAAASAFRIAPEFEMGQHIAGKLPGEIEGIALRDDDVTAEVVVFDPAGSEHVYRVTAATADADGARALVLADITDQRDLDRKKADFLAVIGHELRTPLTSIKGYAWTLARHGAKLPATQRQEAIDSILTQSQRLERLIEDLLYISQVESSRPPLHLGWDDVVAVCNNVIGELGSRHEDRMVLLDRPGTDLPIYTDRVKVEQIVWHLMDNALKYSEPDTDVRVRISAEPDGVRVAITDIGPGIYTKDIERIFEPFTQLDPSSTRRHGGTGTGLYVAKTLAEMLGGGIEVESVLGKGSTFTVRLPRKSGDPQTGS